MHPATKHIFNALFACLEQLDVFRTGLPDRHRPTHPPTPTKPAIRPPTRITTPNGLTVKVRPRFSHPHGGTDGTNQ